MRLPQDANRFESLTGGIKNIVLAAAVLFGGLWTAYTFWSLKSLEIAQLDYQSKSERRPSLEVSLATETIEAEVDNYSDPKLRPKRQVFIQVTSTVKNNGNYPALVDVSSDSLVVSRLNSGSSGGEIQTGSRPFNVLGAKGPLKAFFLSPGNKTDFQYMVDVQYSGLHIIEFRMPQDPRILEILPKTTSDVSIASSPTYLRTSKYVHVPAAFLLKKP